MDDCQASAEHKKYSATDSGVLVQGRLQTCRTGHLRGPAVFSCPEPPLLVSRQQSQLPLSSAGMVYPGALSMAGMPSPQMPSEHSSMSSSPEPNANHHQNPNLSGLKGDEPRIKEELRLDDSNGDVYDDFDYEDEEADYASDDNHIPH